MADTRKASGRLRAVLLILMGLLLAAPVLGLAACGGGSDKSKSSAANAGGDNQFDVESDTEPGAGPVPLKVKFSAKPVHADGDVTYKWSFGEGGATATGQNVTYTYTKSGWKLPRVTAEDEAGHKNFFASAVRVWPKGLWEEFSSGKISPARSRQILVANLRAYERKTGAKIAGISAPPLEGQTPLTAESRRAARKQPALIRRANRRSAREFARKQRGGKAQEAAGAAEQEQVATVRCP